MTLNNSYKTCENEHLSITTYDNNSGKAKNCIIYVHGFKGFKDWGFVPYLGNYLADKGFFIITFNFSHNGIGQDQYQFTELDKFGSNTFSRELEELNELINAYKSGFFGEYSGGKVGLLGHSRGGGISLIVASENKNIDCIAVWSSVAKFDRYSERQKQEWRKKGFFEVVNSRTKQVMKLNSTLLEDIEKHSRDKLNIEKAVGNLKKRLLIIHGEQDLAVPIKEAEDIYSWSDKNLTEFIKIAAAGHTYDIIHPFEHSNRKFDTVLDATNAFFQIVLNSRF
jgi:pimeloyl-ACP methyl ester carboxylesterase